MARTIRLSDQVLVRDLDGEAVLLDLASQRYFGLDEVGMAIWKLLETHGDPAQVVEEMLSSFDVERARLEQDLEVFLGQLEAAGLVRVEGASAETGATRSGDGAV